MRKAQRSGTCSLVHETEKMRRPSRSSRRSRISPLVAETALSFQLRSAASVHSCLLTAANAFTAHPNWRICGNWNEKEKIYGSALFINLLTVELWAHVKMGASLTNRPRNDGRFSCGARPSVLPDICHGKACTDHRDICVLDHNPTTAFVRFYFRCKNHALRADCTASGMR